MLEYKDNLLKDSKQEINTAESILTLKTDLDKDVVVFGELLLNNGSSLITQFTIFEEGIMKAKLTLDETSKPFLSNANFKLIITDALNTKETNSVKLLFNLEKINFSIKKNKSDEIKKIYTKLNSLESILNHLAKGHALENITVLNKDYIKKGMILQTVDEQGNFIACYPFMDMVKEINGRKAVNSSIILDASMIQYNQEQTIKDAIIMVKEALQLQQNIFKAQKDLLLKLQNDVSDLKIKVEQHINDGII